MSGLHRVLHGVALSPFVRKVRCALALKGISYDLVNVMPGAMDSAFRAKSPLAKIPVWEEGGWSLPDSSAITAYLERIEPEPPLYPSQARAYGEALFWEEYADTRLVDTLVPIFFQRIVNARVFGKPSDEEVVRRQLDEVLPPVFDQVEELFFASEISGLINIGTISMWSPLVNLSHAGVEVDGGEWPNLAEFMSKMNAEPSLKAILDEERAALAAY